VWPTLPGWPLRHCYSSSSASHSSLRYMGPSTGHAPSANYALTTAFRESGIGRRGTKQTYSTVSSATAIQAREYTVHSMGAGEYRLLPYLIYIYIYIYIVLGKLCSSVCPSIHPPVVACAGCVYGRLISSSTPA